VIELLCGVISMNKRAESALDELWGLFFVIKIIVAGFLIFFLFVWGYFWITGKYFEWPF